MVTTYFYGGEILGCFSVSQRPHTGQLVSIDDEDWRIIEVRYPRQGVCHVFCTVPMCQSTIDW